MNEREALREEMRQGREARGLSRRELAKLVGCSETLIMILEEDIKSVTNPRIAARIFAECGIREKERLQLVTNECHWEKLPDIPEQKRPIRRALAKRPARVETAMVRLNAKRLEEIVVEKHMTYRAISLAIGRGEGYIYETTHKDRRIPYVTLESIAEMLHVKPEELLKGEKRCERSPTD